MYGVSILINQFVRQLVKGEGRRLPLTLKLYLQFVKVY